MRSRPVAVLLALAASAIAAPTAGATVTGDDGSYISFSATPGGFPLVADGTAAPIVVSSADRPGVVRVVDDLQADVERVTGVKPAVATDDVPAQSDVVLVGTIGKSPLIDELVGAGKLDVGLEVADDPDHARVVARADDDRRRLPAGHEREGPRRGGERDVAPAVGGCGGTGGGRGDGGRGEDEQDGDGTRAHGLSC